MRELVAINTNWISLIVLIAMQIYTHSRASSPVPRVAYTIYYSFGLNVTILGYAVYVSFQDLASYIATSILFLFLFYLL